MTLELEPRLLLNDYELYLHAEGTNQESYRTLGAHLIAIDGVDGVRFAVWAPNAKTVSVIDLEANPVRVIDHVTVGDSPEGLAISPKGDLAVSVEARGSNMPKTAFFYHPSGAVTALKIDGKKVTNVGEISVGTLPEAVAFSPDGSYLYVGNFIDGDLSILKVDGANVTDTGQRLKLPGHPASMRSGPQ